MNHRVSILFLLVFSGCSSVAPLAPLQSAPSAAAQLVARADGFAQSGDRRGAQYLYQQVVREFPNDPAAATALYRVGRLESDPTSDVRNYRAAYASFTRLATEYPDSPWAPDARVWQAILADLISREDEAARIRQQLRWREEEAAELRHQIQQLKSVDLSLERRR